MKHYASGANSLHILYLYAIAPPNSQMELLFNESRPVGIKKITFHREDQSLKLTRLDQTIPEACDLTITPMFLSIYHCNTSSLLLQSYVPKIQVRAKMTSCQKHKALVGKMVIPRPAAINIHPLKIYKFFVFSLQPRDNKPVH